MARIISSRRRRPLQRSDLALQTSQQNARTRFQSALRRAGTPATPERIEQVGQQRAFRNVLESLKDAPTGQRRQLVEQQRAAGITTPETELSFPAAEPSRKLSVLQQRAPDDPGHRLEDIGNGQFFDPQTKQTVGFERLSPRTKAILAERKVQPAAETLAPVGKLARIQQETIVRADANARIRRATTLAAKDEAATDAAGAFNLNADIPIEAVEGNPFAEGVRTEVESLLKQMGPGKPNAAIWLRVDSLVKKLEPIVKKWAAQADKDIGLGAKAFISRISKLTPQEQGPELKELEQLNPDVFERVNQLSPGGFAFKPDTEGTKKDIQSSLKTINEQITRLDPQGAGSTNPARTKQLIESRTRLEAQFDQLLGGGQPQPQPQPQDEQVPAIESKTAQTGKGAIKRSGVKVGDVVEYWRYFRGLKTYATGIGTVEKVAKFSDTIEIQPVGDGPLGEGRVFGVLTNFSNQEKSKGAKDGAFEIIQSKADQQPRSISAKDVTAGWRELLNNATPAQRVQLNQLVESGKHTKESILLENSR